VTFEAKLPGSTKTMKSKIQKVLSLTLILALSVVAYGQQQFDVIIRGGTVYDGTGRAPLKADGVRERSAGIRIYSLTERYSLEQNKIDM